MCGQVSDGLTNDACCLAIPRYACADLLHVHVSCSTLAAMSNDAAGKHKFLRWSMADTGNILGGWEGDRGCFQHMISNNSQTEWWEKGALGRGGGVCRGSEAWLQAVMKLMLGGLANWEALQVCRHALQHNSAEVSLSSA